MNEGIQTGFMLLAIGLPTVFFVLLLVIALVKGLILAVNKFAPESVLGTTSLSATSEPVRQEISSSKMSAIISAVNIITGGKGKVVKIEKQ
jgi:oxaloacetate decarboxylase gamma subunit